jgi:hypothetical protein
MSVELPSRTIQSLWIGERLSRIEVLSITSFLAHGHPYHLYTYGPVENVPAGAVIKDANAIIDATHIFRAKGSLSIFADWFRQEMLHACGGYWADLDMVCLRPLPFDDEIVVGRVDASRVSNALIRFPKGHPITRQLADVSREPNMVMPYDSPRDRRRKLVRRYLLGNRRTNTRWGEASGPAGLTRMLKHHDLMGIAKPYYYFYPLHFSFWACAFDDTFREGPAFLDQSYCLHLWNEKIRRMTGVDKDGPFRKHSLVHQMMKRYRC